MKKTWPAAFVTGVLFMSMSGWAQNPQTDASDRNYDTNQPNSVPGGMQKTEDGANRALNKVDHGVHKGVHKTKHGAKKAKHKMQEGVDKMSEPAKEPANP